MTASQKAIDAQLLARVEKAALESKGWLDSPKSANRLAPFQYPAAMVPRMQADLLDALLLADARINSVLDPFVGSGVAMLQALNRGLDFYGQDSNPLAILLCAVRASFIDPFQLREEIELLLLQVSHNASPPAVEVAQIPNAPKWFPNQVLVELLALRVAIRACDNEDIRRLFWVALAETVRLTSNDRTSTFKLHIRSELDRAGRALSPINIWGQVVNATAVQIAEDHGERQLQKAHIEVKRGDTSQGIAGTRGPYDVLLTSPPYGTTPALSLMVSIPTCPCILSMPTTSRAVCPQSSCELPKLFDRHSLGGKRGDVELARKTLGYSAAFLTTMDRLASAPADRAQRVASFSLDLVNCVPHILRALKPNAYMAWTVGNRTVAGDVVPTDQILVDTLKHHGSYEIGRVTRTIPSHRKHLAARNQLGATIGGEIIILTRTSK